MTTNLTLHTALGNLRITAPLRDGSVTIPGVTFEDVGKTDYVDIWRTQARTVEYDVSLMSVVSFLCAREYGIPFTIKLGELDPSRGCAVCEYVSNLGDEPPDHTHGTEDEIFIVMQGRVSFHCDGKEFEAGPGDFVYLPVGLKHGYNILEAPLRLFAITFPTTDPKPGGWGGFIADMEQQPS